MHLFEYYARWKMINDDLSILYLSKSSSSNNLLFCYLVSLLSQILSDSYTLTII